MRLGPRSEADHHHADSLHVGTQSTMSSLAPTAVVGNWFNACMPGLYNPPMRFAVFLLLALISSPALQADGLSWSSDSGPAGRFLAVHGRRSATFGYSENGLESWAYPVQILTSFGVSFRRPQAVDAIEGQTLLRRIVYSPEAVTRIYVGPDFVVREKIFVPLEQASTLISYEVDGRNPVDIVVHFTPVLDLMWPASLGGQEIRWDTARSGYLLSEGSGRYTALIASPQVVAHDAVHNANRGGGSGLAFVIRPDTLRQAHIFISGGALALSDGAALDRDARDHYQNLLDQALQIETPDDQVNRALAWSEIAVDQAWVCNPDFGCGLVGGYGASRRGRRPQYDWFFAGDGLVATDALLASGQYTAARAELEFILRYQDRRSGMIWHELSQSAASVNWKAYPYMYVHVGLTADLLASAAAYYRASGDAGFVENHWAALQLAYRYGRSLLNSGGLPEIPAGKQGANEQDALGDELSLSAGWVAAAEAFADLAGATGHRALEKDARVAARRARDAIAERYWDEQQHYWISGHTRTGAATQDRESRPSSTVLQGLFSAEQRAAGLNQLADGGLSERLGNPWETLDRCPVRPQRLCEWKCVGNRLGGGSCGVLGRPPPPHRAAHLESARCVEQPRLARTHARDSRRRLLP